MYAGMYEMLYLNAMPVEDAIALGSIHGLTSRPGFMKVCSAAP